MRTARGQPRRQTSPMPPTRPPLLNDEKHRDARQKDDHHYSRTSSNFFGVATALHTRLDQNCKGKVPPLPRNCRNIAITLTMISGPERFSEALLNARKLRGLYEALRVASIRWVPSFPNAVFQSCHGALDVRGCRFDVVSCGGAYVCMAKNPLDHHF